MSQKKQRAPPAFKPVQQAKFEGSIIYMIVPENGPVGLTFHSGPELKKGEEIGLEHLCFHKIVTDSSAWLPEKAGKAQPKALYVRTVRTVKDGKSKYRPLTKAQKLKLYKGADSSQVLKLEGGIEVPLIDASVKRFLKEYDEAKAARKKKRESPKGSPTKVNIEKKRRRLQKEMEKLDAAARKLE